MNYECNNIKDLKIVNNKIQFLTNVKDIDGETTQQVTLTIPSNGMINVDKINETRKCTFTCEIPLGEDGVFAEFKTLK